MLKGLVLKNLYSSRFYIISTAILQIIMYVFMVLTIDILHERFMIAELSIFPYIIWAIEFIFIMLFSSFSLNPILEDKKCGWENFVPTLPVKEGTQLKARLIAAGIYVMINTLLVIIVNTVIAVIIDKVLVEAFYLMPVVTAALEFTALSVGIRMNKKLSFHVAEIWYVVIIVIYMIAAICFIVMYLSEEIDDNIFKATIAVITVGLLIPACWCKNKE